MTAADLAAFECVCLNEDVTGDCCVDIQDYLAVLGGWGPCPVGPNEPCADTDGNGMVDINDLLAVLGAWGQGQCAP